MGVSHVCSKSGVLVASEESVGRECWKRVLEESVGRERTSSCRLSDTSPAFLATHPTSLLPQLNHAILLTKP